MLMPLKVTIVENSTLARIAAIKLKANNVAMVLGRTIYLHGTTKEAFLQNKCWLRHEIAHVLQWQKMGKLRFGIMYLVESVRKGYYNNKFEVEARSKEHDQFILANIIVN